MLQEIGLVFLVVQLDVTGSGVVRNAYCEANAVDWATGSCAFQLGLSFVSSAGGEMRVPSVL
jgi:hypothetical protein